MQESFIDEKWMLTQVSQGNRQAYSIMFSLYYNKVLRFLCGFIGDREEARNVAQDTFLCLWERREKLSSIDNLSGYLFVLSRNAAIKALKRKQSMVSADEIFNRPGSDTADDEVFLAETLRIIKITINAMPQRRREVFIMSRLQGMSNDDIAAACGISKHTVESHITSALADIRKALAICILLFFHFY